MATTTVTVTGGGVAATKAAMAERLTELAGGNAPNMVSAFHRVWGVMVAKLHLSRPIGFLRTSWGWLAEKVTWVAGKLGVTGGLGAGLLLLSTKAGRKAFDKTIGRATRFVAKVVSSGWRAMIRGLRHLGWPGRKLADGLDWITGKVNKGLCKVGRFLKEHTGSFFTLGNAPMRLTKVAGFAMLAAKVVMMIPNPWIVVPLLLGIAAASVYEISEIAAVNGWLGEKIKHTALVEERTKVLFHELEAKNKKEFKPSEAKSAWKGCEARAEEQITAEQKLLKEQKKAKAAAKKAKADAELAKWEQRKLEEKVAKDAKKAKEDIERGAAPEPVVTTTTATAVA